MVTITLYVISGVFFAFECGAAMERKGYDPTAWYVLGFIFGVWTRIVIFFIKDNTEEVDKAEIKRIVQADQVRVMKSDIELGRVWVCPLCRKVNDTKIYTCSCGTRKPHKVVSQKVTKPIVETWICKNCGAENSGHVYICKCGMKKSQNDECSTQ